MDRRLNSIILAAALALPLLAQPKMGSAADHGCRSCDDVVCCCPVTEGTLFRWSSAPDQTGGPNLDEPLVTDRPDFTEASSTVGRGVAQLEFGYTYLFDDDGASTTRSHSWGEPLLRYGILADWLEFRLAIFPTTETVSQAAMRQTTSGAEDLYLGFKLGLTPGVGILPEMAIIPQMTVPTGSTAFTANEVLPGVNWLYAWDLTERISTGGSTQFNRSVDGSGESYTEWAQSWTVAVSLTDRLGGYTEYFGLYPHSAVNAQPQHFFNGGITYLVTDNVQFDIRGGTGLNSAAADYFVGTGLSIRYY